MAGDFDIGPADYEADMSDNGKGDTPRPIVVDQETYKKNWEQTFDVAKMDDQAKKAYSKAIRASLDVYNFLDDIAEKCKGDHQNPKNNPSSSAGLFVNVQLPSESTKAFKKIHETLGDPEE